ncbi:hypothetical protein IGI37_001110 [Enterococcus sp. AZ194]|uniref:carboxymuconolactone decarboxylase family protein n=1 Tax=Enterococcus sp. AZ194 TaxID=2774629 RepID=UPI003F28E72B
MNQINLFEELGQTGTSYMKFVKVLAAESALEEKTQHLAYLSVLTAKGMTDGLDFHVKELLRIGATRAEIKSAILVAMPVIGMGVAPILKIALEICDQ